MQQYHDLVLKVLNEGKERPDRTGVGTKSIFGHQMRFNLQEGFPLLTTKKLHFKSIIIELLWFLKGDTNTKWLQENGVTIWDEWADIDGNLGPIYGAQWRNWNTNGVEYDQITSLISNLKTHPFSRRHIISSWNIHYLPYENMSPQENVNQGLMALSPCHCLFQFYAEDIGEDQKRLSCQLYQRSGDVFLGIPYNIASYAALTHMVAQQCNMVVGEFIHTIGDAHLYSNHIDQANELLDRDIDKYPLPTLEFNRIPDSIFDYNYNDFELIGYQSYPHIKAPIAI